MYRDARITLYGAVVIGGALFVLGLATNEPHAIAATGLAIMGTGTMVALAFDFLAAQAETDGQNG